MEQKELESMPREALIELGSRLQRSVNDMYIVLGELQAEYQDLQTEHKNLTKQLTNATEDIRRLCRDDGIIGESLKQLGCRDIVDVIRGSLVDGPTPAWTTSLMATLSSASQSLADKWPQGENFKIKRRPQRSVTAPILREPKFISNKENQESLDLKLSGGDSSNIQNKNLLNTIPATTTTTEAPSSTLKIPPPSYQQETFMDSDYREPPCTDRGYHHRHRKDSEDEETAFIIDQFEKPTFQAVPPLLLSSLEQNSSQQPHHTTTNSHPSLPFLSALEDNPFREDLLQLKDSEKRELLTDRSANVKAKVLAWDLEDANIPQEIELLNSDQSSGHTQNFFPEKLSLSNDNVDYNNFIQEQEKDYNNDLDRNISNVPASIQHPAADVELELELQICDALGLAPKSHSSLTDRVKKHPLGTVKQLSFTMPLEKGEEEKEEEKEQDKEEEKEDKEKKEKDKEEDLKIVEQQEEIKFEEETEETNMIKKLLNKNDGLTPIGTPCLNETDNNKLSELPYESAALSSDLHNDIQDAFIIQTPELGPASKFSDEVVDPKVDLLLPDSIEPDSQWPLNVTTRLPTTHPNTTSTSAVNDITENKANCMLLNTSPSNVSLHAVGSQSDTQNSKKTNSSLNNPSPLIPNTSTNNIHTKTVEEESTFGKVTEEFSFGVGRPVPPAFLKQDKVSTKKKIKLHPSSILPYPSTTATAASPPRSRSSNAEEIKKSKGYTLQSDPSSSSSTILPDGEKAISSSSTLSNNTLYSECDSNMEPCLYNTSSPSTTPLLTTNNNSISASPQFKSRFSLDHHHPHYTTSQSLFLSPRSTSPSNSSPRTPKGLYMGRPVSSMIDTQNPVVSTAAVETHHHISESRTTPLAISPLSPNVPTRSFSFDRKLIHNSPSLSESLLSQSSGIDNNESPSLSALERKNRSFKKHQLLMSKFMTISIAQPSSNSSYTRVCWKFDALALLTELTYLGQLLWFQMHSDVLKEPLKIKARSDLELDHLTLSLTGCSMTTAVLKRLTIENGRMIPYLKEQMWISQPHVITTFTSSHDQNESLFTKYINVPLDTVIDECPCFIDVIVFGSPLDITVIRKNVDQDSASNKSSKDLQVLNGSETQWLQLGINEALKASTMTASLSATLESSDESLKSYGLLGSIKPMIRIGQTYQFEKMIENNQKNLQYIKTFEPRGCLWGIKLKEQQQLFSPYSPEPAPLILKDDNNRHIENTTKQKRPLVKIITVNNIHNKINGVRNIATTTTTNDKKNHMTQTYLKLQKTKVYTLCSFPGIMILTSSSDRKYPNVKLTPTSLNCLATYYHEEKEEEEGYDTNNKNPDIKEHIRNSKISPSRRKNKKNTIDLLNSFENEGDEETPTMLISTSSSVEVSNRAISSIKNNHQKQSKPNTNNYYHHNNKEQDCDCPTVPASSSSSTKLRQRKKDNNSVVSPRLEQITEDKPFVEMSSKASPQQLNDNNKRKSKSSNRYTNIDITTRMVRANDLERRIRDKLRDDHNQRPNEFHGQQKHLNAIQKNPSSIPRIGGHRERPSSSIKKLSSSDNGKSPDKNASFDPRTDPIYVLKVRVADDRFEELRFSHQSDLSTKCIRFLERYKLRQLFAPALESVAKKLRDNPIKAQRIVHPTLKLQVFMQTIDIADLLLLL